MPSLKSFDGYSLKFKSEKVVAYVRDDEFQTINIKNDE